MQQTCVKPPACSNGGFGSLGIVDVSEHVHWRLDAYFAPLSHTQRFACLDINNLDTRHRRMSITVVQRQYDLVNFDMVLFVRQVSSISFDGTVK